jgi:hypothetical protein
MADIGEAAFKLRDEIGDDGESLTFWLEFAGPNVQLKVVDEGGNEYWLVDIQKRTGKLFLHAGLPDNLGLDVDKVGHLRIEKQ